LYNSSPTKSVAKATDIIFLLAVSLSAFSPCAILLADKIKAYVLALEMLQGRVGNSYDITRAAMLLCRRNSGFISGESITVDGGMTRPMI